MRVIKKVHELKQEIEILRRQDKTIGFVPTMGALHDGHLYLVDCAAKENDVVVVSIFVNPIQFNNPEDLKRYPRNLEKDAELLSYHNTDFIFAPDAQEIYPDKVTKTYDFGSLDKVMEGKFRPGHFTGVATVVHRLFNIVEPDRAYFGEKDFQQLAVIRQLVKQENIPVDITGCPIIREANGLAMSSRNQRLSPQSREKAALIYKTLKRAVEMSHNQTVQQVKRFVENELKENLIEPEYFEIVDSTTLQPINNWQDTKHPRGCIAAYIDDVRLIDNIAF